MDVQVQTDDTLRCARGRQPLLHAAMPDPDAAGGRSTRVLCSACDAGSPTGGELLAWFADHPVVDEADVGELSALLSRWLEDITPPDLDAAELDAARAAWRDLS